MSSANTDAKRHRVRMTDGLDTAMSKATRDDAAAERGHAKVALVANCLLNQNAKVCQGAHYAGAVSPVVRALRARGYRLLQLPCPELAFAGVRRWWAVYEQYDTPVYRTHCKRLAQAIAPFIERHLRAGAEVILVGLDGSPSTGVRFTSSRPDWGGRPNRPDDDWEVVPRRGVWIEELEAELARRGLPALPATGWALDMGAYDEAGSLRDLEAFLDAQQAREQVTTRLQESQEGASGATTRKAGMHASGANARRVRQPATGTTNARGAGGMRQGAADDETAGRP